jgi:Transglycosylase-like domain
MRIGLFVLFGTVLAISSAVAAQSSEGGIHKPRWWVGHSLEYRLDGQLELRREARRFLALVEKFPALRRIEPAMTANAEREANIRLRVLRREIPQTRKAIAAAKRAAAASPTSAYYPAVVSAYAACDAIPAYIVACESGGDPNAVNSSSGAYGCYQIMPFHWGPGGVCDDLGDVGDQQDECARRIWDGAGPGAWACA